MSAARCSYGHGIFRTDMAASPSKSNTKDKNIRKMLKLREARRSAGISNECFSLECEEDHLSEAFWEQCDKLLNSHSSAIECYHIVTNSLTLYFSNKTWSDNVEVMCAAFIRDCVIRSHQELCQRYDSDETDCHKRRILDYELNALLEMHLLRFYPKPLEQTDIGRKIMFVNYLADGERMKKFVDEGISDLFSLMLPLYVTGLHEELSLDIPCDLEEFESAEHKMSQDNLSVFNGANSRAMCDEDTNEGSDDGGDDSERSERVRRSMRGQAGVSLVSGDELPKICRKRLNKAISEMHDELDEDEEGNEENASKLQRRRSSRNQRSDDQKSPTGNVTVKREVLSTPTRAPKKGAHPRKSFVPETPDEKLNRRKREDLLEDDVVKQTPAGKIRNRKDKDAAKYRELLKQCESNKAKIEARSRNALNSPAVNSSFNGGSIPTISRRNLLNNSPAKAGEDSLSSRGNLRSAKVNLKERFAAAQRESSSGSSTPKPQTDASVRFGLTPKVIGNYSEVINKIYNNSAQIDDQTVFYGRNTTHENIFQDDDDGEMTTKPKSRQTQQKNRSGRSVNPSANCTNMAHVLLNVDNENPLTKARPLKNPESPFKMKKLLRHDSGSRKRAAKGGNGRSSKKFKNNSDSIKQEEADEMEES